MARKEAMGQIDAMLSAPPENKQIDLVVPTPDVLAPEKKADSKKAEKDQEQERLKAAKEAERKQEEQETALKALPETLKGIWKSTQINLGKIPTYGSLMLPLSILLIFFFLLLPVNGHTRAMWLWLVLTGQAEISGGGASRDFGPPPVNSAIELGQEKQIVPLINLTEVNQGRTISTNKPGTIYLGTYVEDL